MWSNSLRRYKRVENCLKTNQELAASETEKMTWVAYHFADVKGTKIRKIRKNFKKHFPDAFTFAFVARHPLQITLEGIRSRRLER